MSRIDSHFSYEGTSINRGRNTILHMMDAHKKHDRPSPKPSGVKPSEKIATIGDHTLIHTFRDSWFDTHPKHGWSYLGRGISDDDAMKRWHDKLKREGAM